MKAVRLARIGAPLIEQDVPVPVIGHEDILVHVRAAGVCHSDAHYRAGTSPVRFLPITLGHEVAGVVDAIGPGVTGIKVGDRVCLHYNVTCGDCTWCVSGNEQFCASGLMIGHHRDGGFAQLISVPARNALPLPAEIPFPAGATLMCASATAFHALRKARLAAGETAAIIGVGGLGMSAVQLARAFGAMTVFAVDVREESLALASRYGAVAVNARSVDPVQQIRKLTGGRGVDVAVELIGMSLTMHQAVQCLSPLGRAVLVGITKEPLTLDTYTEVLGGETQVIGSNDHLLDITQVVTRTIPLEAAAINAALDGLEKGAAGIRTAVVP
jgi:propanol-preferring alcohol dehydrogenase